MRFEGKAYLDHTTCVTEAQRYQGALYVHKENKGEVKQEAWSSSVQTKVAKASATLRPYAEKLIAYDNVPRKKAKFINFAKNSLNLKHDPKGISKKRKRDEDEEDKAVSARPVDGLWVECAAAVPLRLPGKRQKGEPQPPIDTATKPIKWKAIITKELESVGGTMSLKELRRAAVAEVQAHPSHQGRKAKQLKEEFDEVFPTFHKYAVVDGQVALATKAEAMAGVT